MKNCCISPMLRQKRENGCDSARCIVKIGGRRKFYYLGAWGSGQARAHYERLVAKYGAEVFPELGEEETPQAPNSSPVPISSPATVLPSSGLENLFNSYTLEFLGSDKLSRDQCHDRDALMYAREAFPHFPKEFSMSVLGDFQNYLVRIAPEVREGVNRAGQRCWKKKKWSRTYINRLVKSFKKILAWGINHGYLSPMFRESIRLYPGISAANPRGLSNNAKRDAVRDSDVIATLPFLSPVCAAMVKLQRAACLRPSEICDLKVGDVVFTDSGAIVDKAKNKIARTGVHRQIAFGTSEAKILRQFCEGREPDEYVFRMHEHMTWFVRRSRKDGKKNVSEKYLSRFAENFSTENYDKNVKRAVLRAMKENPEVKYWTPYQLRHAAYSAISAQYGYDVASKVAGHLSPNLARVYDHSAAVVSQKVAAERERGWWE